MLEWGEWVRESKLAGNDQKRKDVLSVKRYMTDLALERFYVRVLQAISDPDSRVELKNLTNQDVTVQMLAS